MSIHSRAGDQSGARNTELVAGALAVLLVPAILVKFLFNGSRISFTAINFIQLALMAGLLNLTVHLAAKATRWVGARPSKRRSVRAHRSPARGPSAMTNATTRQMTETPRDQLR
jgi:hypothetical protein